MNVTGLDADLAGARSVLVDSSTLLAFVNANEIVHPLAVHLFTRIAEDTDTLQGFFSAVSVTECLARPYQRGAQATATMSALLQGFPHLLMVPVDYAIGDRAAYVRAQANLRTPDALIAATAIVNGLDAVVSNDEKWPRLRQLYPRIRWLYLDGYRPGPKPAIA